MSDSYSLLEFTRIKSSQGSVVRVVRIESSALSREREADARLEKRELWIRAKGDGLGTRVAPFTATKGDRLEQGEVPADLERWIANGGLTHRKLAMAFSGERSHNASRLRAICGLLVLPALVEAGFQENPTARILVFSELHRTL